MAGNEPGFVSGFYQATFTTRFSDARSFPHSALIGSMLSVSDINQQRSDTNPFFKILIQQLTELAK
jgi:hypothetical protein